METIGSLTCSVCSNVSSPRVNVLSKRQPKYIIHSKGLHISTRSQISIYTLQLLLISEEDQAGIPEDVSEDDSISGLLESESRRANLIFKDQKIQTLKVIDSSVNNERACCSRLALNSKKCCALNSLPIFGVCLSI